MVNIKKQVFKDYPGLILLAKVKYGIVIYVTFCATPLRTGSWLCWRALALTTMPLV